MDTIKICSWNANGLRNKLAEVSEFLDRHSIDLIMINETKCTNNVKLSIRNYKCIRKDRDNAAGGVSMFIKNNIPYKELQLDLKKLLNVGEKVIIYGDLNARNRSWNCHIENKNGKTLFKYMQNNEGMLIVPNEPTLYPDNGSTPTCIDIGISKNINSISNPEVKQEFSSDHCPVIFTLGNQHKINKKKEFLDYTKADWKLFQELLNKTIKIQNQVINISSIDREVQKLTNILQDGIKKAIPKKHSNKVQDNLPDNITEKIKERNQTRRQWQRTRLEKYKDLSNKQTQSIRSDIFKYRNEQWEKQLEKLNPNDNSLWRMTKIFKKDSQQIPTLIRNNEEAYDSECKANMLADQYEKVHDINLKNNTKEQEKIVEEVKKYMESGIEENYTDYYTTPREIVKIITKLPSQKAPGIDHIQNIVLKHINKKAIIQIMHMTNATIRLSYFPSQWKTGNVIPILKPGKKNTEPSSYRPISLLSAISKLIEKIILKRFTKFETKNNILIDEQFGFRERHGTTQQVARIVNDITIGCNYKKVTVMLLLDIEKAFDRVWIDGLLYKLIHYQFPPSLVKLINSYLNNRYFIVNVDGYSSTKRKILAGVPQGSVLGPKLFNIYLNDIPKFSKTKLALFADDTAIYTDSFDAIIAAKQIQIHMRLLEPYYKMWKIKLNEAKTETIIFHKKNNNTKIFQPIIVNSYKTVPTAKVKYLGITLDSKLTYQLHIKQVLRKAYAVQNKIYPLLAKNSKISINNKKLMYKMLIRPIIAYGAPVWYNASKTNKMLL